MKLTKNKKLSLAVIFIIMAIYNVVVFVFPFNRSIGFWIGYGFSMLAILITTGVSFFAFAREGLQSKFYRIPLIFVVWCYLAIQLVVGLLEMILQFIPFQYGIAVNIVLLGICLIGLITVSATKDEIERIDGKIKEKVFYIKSLQTDIEGLHLKISDESLKKLLKDLTDAIRYSDPMSSSQLAAIENKIEAKASALSEAVEKAEDEASKALCNELQQLLAERNRKCKLLK